MMRRRQVPIFGGENYDRAFKGRTRLGQSRPDKEIGSPVSSSQIHIRRSHTFFISAFPFDPGVDTNLGLSRPTHEQARRSKAFQIVTPRCLPSGHRIRLHSAKWQIMSTAKKRVKPVQHNPIRAPEPKPQKAEDWRTLAIHIPEFNHDTIEAVSLA